jgi:hypothetical protein
MFLDEVTLRWYRNLSSWKMKVHHHYHKSLLLLPIVTRLSRLFRYFGYLLGYFPEFNSGTVKGMVHAVAQWLRHCGTNRKVAGSIPDGVTGFFH